MARAQVMQQHRQEWRRSTIQALIGCRDRSVPAVTAMASSHARRRGLCQPQVPLAPLVQSRGLSRRHLQEGALMACTTLTRSRLRQATTPCRRRIGARHRHLRQCHTWKAYTHRLREGRQHRCCIDPRCPLSAGHGQRRTCERHPQLVQCCDRTPPEPRGMVAAARSPAGQVPPWQCH